MKKLLLVLVLIGCDSELKTTVSAELMNEVMFAESCLGSLKKTGSITLYDFEEEKVAGRGYSYPNDEYPNFVRISKHYWSFYEELQRKALMIHELLHTEKDKGDLYDANYYGDWMYYESIPEQEVALYWDINVKKYCN